MLALLSIEVFNAYMHRPRNRTRPKEERTGKLTEGLRMAFRHEVRFDDYMLRVWVTSVLAGAVVAYLVASRGGQFDLNIILPSGGVWHARDPQGALYIETWGTILVNAMQVGFGLWGAVLIFLGSYRAFTAHKFVFGCFSLGIAFVGFALVLPSWTQILLNMIVERCPMLVS